MARLKIGIDIAGMRLPPNKALQSAAELGADAVELDARGAFAPANLSHTGLRQLRKMLDDCRLRVASVRFRTRRGYDNPADLDRRVEATKAAMQLAGRLGARSVANRVGRLREEDGEDRLLLEVLADLAEYGNRVGAFLAAETSGESPADLATLMEKLPKGIIGVDFSPGEFAALGHSPTEAVELLGPRILHVRATDGVCDLSSRRGSRVELGEGIADFPALLATLDGCGYQGYFTIEPLGDSSFRAEAVRAIALLRQF